MRLKILLIICCAVLFGCLYFMASLIRSQTTEISSLRERVYNLELVINQGLLDKKEAASHPETMKKAEPGLSI